MSVTKKNYFVVVQLMIEIYSLPVSTANGIIWSIDRPILLAPYLLIVQSEKLLLLKPIIFTKNSMVHNV